jgi:hypothetical protein
MSKVDHYSEGWVQVGIVNVDSGTCLIVDPTYHRDGIYGIEEVESATMATVASPSNTAALVSVRGEQIGTVVQTGYGDDQYPVEIRYVVDQRGTRRIAELRVRFIADL